MGAMIVALLAVLVMLVAAVTVAVLRLGKSMRQLLSTVQHTRDRLQPTIDELTEGSKLISLETEHLQRSIAALNAARRNGAVRGQMPPTGHLGQVPVVESSSVHR